MKPEIHRIPILLLGPWDRLHTSPESPHAGPLLCQIWERKFRPHPGPLPQGEGERDGRGNLLARFVVYPAVFSVLLAAVAVSGGCSRPGIKGDGTMKTENRPVSDFSALHVSGAYQIKWSSGKPALTISTDQNLLPLITTSVNGKTLEIDWKETLRPTRGITINVSSASLTDMQLNGAVSLTASNLSGGDLKLESNGASSISVDGSVTNLDANLSGASKLDAKSLRTQTATVSLNGACYADVTVTETLNASIAGAGALTYGGNPKSVERNVSGVGRIQSRP